MNFNELLIAEVRKHQCLYDPSLKDYRNLQKKDAIWKEVGKTLNSSSDNCRRRWKTLRDTFRKTKRANELISGSGTLVPRKKWKYEDELYFLDNFKDSKPTVESVEIKEEENSVSFLDYGDTISAESTMPQDDLNFEPSCSVRKDSGEVETDLDSQCSSIGMLSSAHSSEKAKKRRANDELKETFVKAMDKCVASINELAKAPKRNSTFLLFESFAEKITDANLSKADVNKIEAKLLSVVYEELAKCDENN